VVVVAQAAPDLVLRERTSRTLEYLLATRLPDGAILGGKVLVAAVVGCASGLLNAAVQLVTHHLRAGGPWSWAWLAWPEGRLIALVLTPEIALYLAVVGTFVALRVGDQRAAYMVTMLSLGVLALPLLLQLVPFRFTVSWLWSAAGTLAAVVAVLLGLAVRLFRRDRIVLYLQE
jgi:ABC-type Na+ efflux pump permease subunit